MPSLRLYTYNYCFHACCCISVYVVWLFDFLCTYGVMSLLAHAGQPTDKMLRGRFVQVIFIVFFVFALTMATDDEPAQCPATSQAKTPAGDDDGDDGGDNEQPCVAQPDVEPTDEAQPAALSLDEGDDEAGDTSPLAGT